jgi:voltage-gated potassium channel Kch
LLLVVVAGAAITAVDSREVGSLEDGIWWAFSTLTTVGYGDVSRRTWRVARLQPW